MTGVPATEGDTTGAGAVEEVTGGKVKKGKVVKESAIAKKLREQLEARKKAEEEAARYVGRGVIFSWHPTAPRVWSVGSTSN